MNGSIDEVNQQGALHYIIHLNVFPSMCVIRMFETAINELIHLFIINSS